MTDDSISIISSHICNFSSDDDNDENSIISEKIISNYSSSFSSSSPDFKLDDPKNIFIKFYNILKCNLCSGNKCILKYCKICKTLICEECIKKQENDNCINCKKRLYEMRFLDDLQLFLEFYNNNLNLNEQLKKEIQKLKEILEEKQCQKCFIHNKKIAYYCFNCHKKLCGICYSFFNDDAKKHEKHNVNDYSLVEKYKINNIIDGLENKEWMKKEEDKIIHLLQLSKDNINSLFKDLIEKIKQTLNIINKRIDISLKNIINFKKQSEIYCKEISDKLTNIKSLEKKEFNIAIDIPKTISELNSLSQKHNSIIEKAKKIIKLNSCIKLKSFNYSLIYKPEKTFEPINIDIISPFKFSLNIEQQNNNICITIPYCIEEENDELKKINKKYILYPFLLNNELGTFQKIRKKKNQNIILLGNNNSYNIKRNKDENEINDVKNDKDNFFGENETLVKDEELHDDYFEYKVYINLNEYINNDKYDIFFYYFYYNCSILDEK